MEAVAVLAVLAVLPGTGARARRYAQEVTARRARGLSGYAATDSDKARLTANALYLFSKSKSDPGAPELRGLIDMATAELGAYDSWTDTSRGWLGDPWHDSQTVRSNLQAANVNVSIALGRTGEGENVSPTWRPQEESLAPVDLLEETLRNIEASRVAACAARGMRYDGKRCVSLPGAGVLGWALVNPGKAAAAVAGIATLGVLAALAIKGYFVGLGSRPRTNFASRSDRRMTSPPTPVRRFRPLLRRVR